MSFDPVFVYGNYIEAGLWAALAGVALIKRNSGWSLGLAAALLLFGISDVVEVRTGAWYEPWWLLVWKSGGVLLILMFGIAVMRVHRRKVDHRAGAAGAERIS